MRRFALLIAVGFLALPVMAAGQPVELPDGRTMFVMNGGEDGVVGARVIPEGRIEPVHPEGLEAMATTVTLAAVVDADGIVQHLDLIAADHPGLGFEQAAEDAVRQWRFEPAHRGKARFHSMATVRVGFNATPEPAVYYSRGGTLGTGLPAVEPLARLSMMLDAPVVPGLPALIGGHAPHGGGNKTAGKPLVIWFDVDRYHEVNGLVGPLDPIPSEPVRLPYSPPPPATRPGGN
jgi:hypothetical protein